MAIAGALLARDWFTVAEIDGLTAINQLEAES
jgi:hypothetical protein